MWYSIVLLLLVSANSGQAYTAAVVHYYPLDGNTPVETIIRNVNEYGKYAKEAKNKGADIIVFPEYGIVTSSALLAAKNYSIEIKHPIISKLSAIAKDNKIYLVVNLFERIDDKHYNANLVFNRSGKLILKYHKIHLFNEFELTPGAHNQTATFSTDFGVTFGIFTCFDLLFVNPSMRVLENGNVKDVVFVLGWLPSDIASSMQQGYSVANGVNLLAANYGKYMYGLSGTGIFLSNGKAAKVINDGLESQLVVKKIQRKQVKKSCPRRVSKRTHTILTTSKYYYHDVDLTKKSTSTKLCNRKLCCTFDITLHKNQKKSTDIYKLMIFHDSVNYNKLKAKVRICALLACSKNITKTCGETTNVATPFKKISVQGNFARDNSTFSRPITMHKSLLPLTPITYCVGNSSSALVRTKNQKNVIIFGLFERRDTVTDQIGDVDGAINCKIFLMLTWGRPRYF